MVKQTGNENEENLFIKPLEPIKAFNKGAEWVSELVFFYGFLIGIATYEAFKFYHDEKRHELEL